MRLPVFFRHLVRFFFGNIKYVKFLPWFSCILSCLIQIFNYGTLRQSLKVLCGLGLLGQCLSREVVFSRKMTKFEKSVFTASNLIQVFSPKHSGTEDWKSFTENKMFPMYRSKKFSFNVPFMMASFLLKVRQSTCSVIGGRYWESSLTRVCSDVLP